jgi:DNA-binding NarL/FixJ family response regulator
VTRETDLSVLVVASAVLRRRCQAVLADHHIASHGVSLAEAPRLLRRYRPRVLLLDAVPSTRRALGILPVLKHLSPATGVVLLGRRRASTPLLMDAVRRGAWGHLAGSELSRDLPKAVRMVAARQPWLPRRLSETILAELLARGDGEKKELR